MYNSSSFLVILICTAVVQMHSTELTSQCNPPEHLPAQLCQNAPLTCLLGTCYATQEWDPNGEPGSWCMGGFSIHNPQYFLFQASDTLVQIRIRVDSCDDDDGCPGLQSAIIDTCITTGQPWYPEDVLSCVGQACAGEIMDLFCDTMVIGQFYWLMIDGNAGDICTYTIIHVEGVSSVDFSMDLNDAGTPDPVVCQGQDTWTAEVQPLIPEAHWYYWYGFPWIPGYHVTPYPNMNGNPVVIPDDAPPGVYNICVFAYSGCDTSGTVCFDLEIVEVPDALAEPEALCPEEYAAGVVWAGIPIDGPGIYTKSFNTSEGCPYDSIKEYMALPAPGVGMIDTFLCEPIFAYENVMYEAGGVYTLEYPGASVFGCDSTAILNLDLVYLDVETNYYCENGFLQLVAEVIEAIPGNAGIIYEWYFNGEVVSLDYTFAWSEPGAFELFVSYQLGAMSCTFASSSNPLVILPEDLAPALPALNPFDSVACSSDTAVYSVVIENGVLHYEWTAEPAEVVLTTQGNQDSEVTVDWQGFAGGTICVSAVNDCGSGPQACFDVVVAPAPVADFTMPAQACVDSVVTLNFSGVAGPDARYIWDFGGGTVHQGGPGPGPYQVSWDAGGVLTVALQVVQEGCDTSEVDHAITLEALGTPLLHCSSTLNSVTFEWSPVNGAVDYIVEVLQGPAGTISDDTSYILQGVAQGTVVEIIVTAIGTGACPPAADTIQCVAEDCPPGVITIDLPSDTFCYGNATNPIVLAAYVDDSLVTGTWHGLGVDPTGVFDPQAVPAGEHTIIFMYTEGNCAYQGSATVTVLESPAATFTADTAICQTESASVVFTGNATSGAQFMWYFGNGAATGSGAGPFDVVWDTPGLYEVTLVVEEYGCVSDTASQVIDVQPTLVTPSIQCHASQNSVAIEWSLVPNAIAYNVTLISGPPGIVNGNRYEVSGLSPGDTVAIELEIIGNTLCPPLIITASCVAQKCPMVVADAGPSGYLDCMDTSTVLGGFSSAGPEYAYLWTTAEGTIVSDPAAPVVTVSGAGLYVLRVTDITTGCSEVDSTFVTIDTLAPSGHLVVADTLDCDTEFTTVSASIVPADVLYSWSANSGQLISGNGTPVIQINRPGLYTLLATDTINGCAIELSAEVKADPMTIQGIDAFIDYPDCVGDEDGMITILQVNGGAPPYIFGWSDQSSGMGLFSLGPGAYAVTVTDANGCVFTESFVVPAPTPLSIDIGQDITLHTGETFTVSLVVSDSGKVAEVYWGGIAPMCPGCFTITGLAEESGWMIVTVIDTAGCTVIDSLQVTVREPRNVFIPNVFSPDGDGINDVFRIHGNTLSQIVYLRIYDRWGSEVYEESLVSPGTAIGWDGTLGGQDVNPGVYVYTTRLVYEDGREEVVSGNVTLVR